MRNEANVRKEVSKRIKEAMQRGSFETDTERHSRVLHLLMKSWIGYNGKLWTTRAYLLAYNRAEYKSTVQWLQRDSGRTTFFDRKGDTLDVFNFFHSRNNGWQHDILRFDGRTPVNQAAPYQKRGGRK